MGERTIDITFAAGVLALLLTSGCGAMGNSSAPGGAAAQSADTMTNTEAAIDAAGGPAKPGTMATVADAGSILGRQWDFTWIDGFDGTLPAPTPGAGFMMTRESGRLVGSTGCNSMSSAYKIDPVAGTLSFPNLQNGQMLCGRAASDTENAVLDAMIATDAFQLSGKTLELRSKGKPVARLTSP